MVMRQVAISEILVGSPGRHRGLSVFPLFVVGEAYASYRLSTEAIADGSVVVEEVSEEGSILDLLVENAGHTRVLFLEGEELLGAKQDRVVNTSVLVPAGGILHLPVSCVEHGRWVHRSERMQASGVHSPTIVRSALKESVATSLEAGLRHASNQAAVWDAVSLLHDRYDVGSRTGAMHDAFVGREAEILLYREKLSYVGGASGLAVAVEDRIRALDVFDRALTCERVWDRLLGGAVFDALGRPDAEASTSQADVERLLEMAHAAPWKRARTVGDGEEWRARVGRDPASKLVCDGVTVHMSVVAA